MARWLTEYLAHLGLSAPLRSAATMQPYDHATGRHRSGCTGAQLQESVWKGRVGTPGAGKTTPACLGVRKALPSSRGFFELQQGRRRPPRFAAMSTSPAAAPCPPLTQSRNHAAGRHPMRRRSCRGYGVEAGAGFAVARSAVRTRSAQLRHRPSLIPDLPHRARWRWVWHGARMPGSGLQRQLRRQGFCRRRPC